MNYNKITSAGTLREISGSWEGLENLLAEMPRKGAFMKMTGNAIEGYAKEMLSALEDKHIDWFANHQTYKYLRAFAKGLQLARRNDVAPEPSLMGIPLQELAEPEPVRHEMGEPVEPAQIVEAPKVVSLPSQNRRGGSKVIASGGVEKELLPASEHSLFRCYYEYAPQPGYDVGYNKYINSEDRPEERKYFAHKGHLRRIDVDLSEGRHPNDIFGYGGFTFGGGVNGWTYNYNRIKKFGLEGEKHKLFGKLVKAYIFFRPLTDGQGMPLCLFAFKDEEYFYNRQKQD